jgi:hypothetical protein
MEQESERREVTYEAGKKYVYNKCVIAGLRREAVEICVFLGCHAAYVGSSLERHWDNLSVPSSRVKLEDGTDGLSRNVRKE